MSTHGSWCIFSHHYSKSYFLLSQISSTFFTTLHLVMNQKWILYLFPPTITTATSLKFISCFCVISCRPSNTFEKVLVTTNNTLMWAISFIVKNFMAPFYGRGSTDSRLEPLRGGFRGGTSGHAASLFFAIALKNYKLCSLKLIMNNVPLTYVYLSATKTCLTPNHLLFGRVIILF